MLFYRNVDGVHGLESLETLGLVKLAFFTQRCCEPVHINFCSTKILIFHGCKVCFWAGDRVSTYEKYK